MRKLGFLVLLLWGWHLTNTLAAQVTPDSTVKDTLAPTGGVKGGVKGSGNPNLSGNGRTVISEDSLAELEEEKEKKIGPRLREPKEPLDSMEKARRAPRRAALLSLALPGAGQVYNHSIWKVPVIYAGLGAITYFVVDNNKSYVAFRDAFSACKDDPTCTQADVDLGSGPRTYQFSDLLSNRENFRRYRDLNIIVGGLWYTLNVLDAYVDAHLRTFDVSDDLSMQVKPKLIFNQAAGNAPVFGAAFTLKLR
jgi:hypothetical protein